MIVRLLPSRGRTSFHVRELSPTPVHQQHGRRGARWRPGEAVGPLVAVHGAEALTNLDGPGSRLGGDGPAGGDTARSCPARVPAVSRRGPLGAQGLQRDLTIQLLAEAG